MSENFDLTFKLDSVKQFIEFADVYIFPPEI